MSKQLSEIYDERHRQLIDETAGFDIYSERFLTAVKGLEAFSKIRPLLPQPDPEPTITPDPRSLSRWERVKAGLSAVWDNETTRVFIKAGGAFAGVALVVYSTIRRDHVIERDAMTQANQRPIN